MDVRYNDLEKTKDDLQKVVDVQALPLHTKQSDRREQYCKLCNTLQIVGITFNDSSRTTVNKNYIIRLCVI